MIVNYSNLNDYFNEMFKTLNCHRDTQSYIVGVYDKYKKSEMDLSKESITLLYCAAKEMQDFAKFQNIGDWIIFASTMFPEHLQQASFDYYANIARISYYSCFKLINKSWPVYENLADDFIPITFKIKQALRF